MIAGLLGPIREHLELGGAPNEGVAADVVGLGVESGRLGNRREAGRFGLRVGPGGGGV